MTAQPDTIHAALGIGEQTQCCLNCRHYDQYYVRDHTRAAYFWPMNARQLHLPDLQAPQAHRDLPKLQAQKEVIP